MNRFEPFALAEKQIGNDRKRTASFHGLFEHKIGRMQASPLAFLRGAAPLFYEILDAHPALARGPESTGWIVGDLHMENFGAYRPGALSSKTSERDQSVHFNINDFDDAVVAPHRFDLLRLLTSFLLAGRELGVTGGQAIDLTRSVLHAYASELSDRTVTRHLPSPVTALLARATKRSRKQLLDARAPVSGKKRQFVRGPRYRAISKSLTQDAEKAFARYAKEMHTRLGTPKSAFEIIDVAFRVAGTGSLGALRLAVLARGKGGRDGAWIFDMKEQDAPSAARIVRVKKMSPAERVCIAATTCLAEPPRMIAMTKINSTSMLVRRLSPQEDKLDLRSIDPASLPALASYLGTLVAQCHLRGAKRLRAKDWRSAKAQEQLVEQSVALAGIHEAVYLAYCERTQKLVRSK